MELFHLNYITACFKSVGHLILLNMPMVSIIASNTRNSVEGLILEYMGKGREDIWPQ